MQLRTTFNIGKNMHFCNTVNKLISDNEAEIEKLQERIDGLVKEADEARIALGVFNKLKMQNEKTVNKKSVNVKAQKQSKTKKKNPGIKTAAFRILYDSYPKEMTLNDVLAAMTAEYNKDFNKHSLQTAICVLMREQQICKTDLKHGKHSTYMAIKEDIQKKINMDTLKLNFNNSKTDKNSMNALPV